MTLALIGGIAGAGIALGLSISWRAVSFVLVLGALAPLVGGLGGFLISRLPGRLPGRSPVSQWWSWSHRLGFAAQCVAYGANDGQKMLAETAIAMGGGVVSPDASQLAIIGCFFALGLVLGLRRIANTLGSRVVVARPADAVAAEFSSAAAVIGSAAAGAPVSMTQAVTGALMGSALTRGTRRVRWRAAFGVVVAWVLTLPAAAVLASLLALAVEAVGGA